jgi:hypothetical protein
MVVASGFFTDEIARYLWQLTIEGTPDLAGATRASARKPLDKRTLGKWWGKSAAAYVKLAKTDVASQVAAAQRRLDTTKDKDKKDAIGDLERLKEQQKAINRIEEAVQHAKLGLDEWDMHAQSLTGETVAPMATATLEKMLDAIAAVNAANPSRTAHAMDTGQWLDFLARTRSACQEMVLSLEGASTGKLSLARARFDLVAKYGSADGRFVPDDQRPIMVWDSAVSRPERLNDAQLGAVDRVHTTLLAMDAMTNASEGVQVAWVTRLRKGLADVTKSFPRGEYSPQWDELASAITGVVDRMTLSSREWTRGVTGTPWRPPASGTQTWTTSSQESEDETKGKKKDRDVDPRYPREETGVPERPSEHGRIGEHRSGGSKL